MKTVGFIDYYLDEWHANNYPDMIKRQSKGEFEVKYAYADVEPPFEDRITNKEWSQKYGIPLVDNIETLIELCDCIIVLSPDNPEMHYELSKKALESGKPVYIDKTFATSKEEALKIFEIAEKYNTPCYSSSALRFSAKLKDIERKDINTVISVAGGPVEIYLIHQLEPIATLMGTEIDKVMYIGNDFVSAWVLHFCDGRTAEIHMLSGDFDFCLHVNHKNGNQRVILDDDFFLGFTDSLIHFFRTSEIPVSHKDTVNIMSLIENCFVAMKKSGEWICI